MNENRTHPVVQVIQGLLDERDISQTELALRLGWGRMRVQRRLTGKADISVGELEEIADVLGIPASRLLGQVAA